MIHHHHFSIFSLDINSGILELTFDETVNAASLRTDTILLQNDENELIANESVTLTTSSYTNSTDDYIIVIHISITDLNEIKRNQYLAQSDTDTFIVIGEDTIQDMNDNGAMAISPRASQPVVGYINDTVPPVLHYFHLDMDNGILCLTFDETVDVSRFQYTGITFFSSDNLTDFEEMYTLSANQQPISEDSHNPCIQLSLSDQYALKLLTHLATSINDTYIDFEYGAIRDMALTPNLLIMTPISVQADNFTKDETPPQLINFSANLNASTLTLLFDEPVNVSSLQYDSFTLLSSNSDTAVNYSFTDGSSPSENGRMITVNITDYDLNEIKKLESLFTSVFDTYLMYATDTVKDMAGNGIVGIFANESEQALSFTIDTTRPSLDAFDIDMTDETLTLYFSETVNFETLNLTSIVLQESESATGTNDSVRLTSDGVVRMIDDTVIVVQLPTIDLDLLKTYKIAINEHTVWLTIDEGGILDQSNERLLPRENNKTALSVSNYTTDITPPTLESFVLDLNGGGLLWLSFSETVNANSFNSTSITLLHSSPRIVESDTSFTLSPSSINWVWDHPIQRVSFSLSDLNEIKRLSLLATNQNNTFISITHGGVDDVFGNPVVEINTTHPFQAQPVIPDSTPPELEYYDLNLTAETIVLSFTETMNASSLSIVDFKLFSESPTNEITSYFQLTLDSGIIGGNPMDQDSTILTIKIGTNDLNIIKQITDLAIDNMTTYLALSSSAAADMSSNPLVPITDTNPRKVSEFYNDYTQPILLSFDLDIDTGVLSLTFDETVNASSIYPDQITLLGEMNNDTEHQYTLSGAKYISSLDDTQILIILTDTDLNEIKRQRGLATNKSTSYLSVTQSLVVDMNSNPVVAINETEAINVTNYTNDTSAPTLLAFELDLTNDTLILSFSETVRVTTLNFNSITIQNEGNTQYYQLTSGNIPMEEDNTVVLIDLDNSDLNEIKKREDLATVENNTYISIDMYLIKDMNSNFNRPRFPEAPLQVSNYTADHVKPYLQEFNLDMDGEGLLQLNFSETVNVSSLVVSAITLLEDSGIVEGSHTLILSYVNSTNSPIVDIIIGREDLNILKMLPLVAKSQKTTFISITDELVLDMNGNNNTAISITEAYVASYFMDDVTPPPIRKLHH